MPVVMLRESDDGTTVTVSAGDRIVLDLPEDPTTGYRWQIEPTGIALTRFATSYTVPENVETGSGGRRRFAFVAGHAAAEGVIHARLRRPWEPVEQAITHHTFTIRVE